MCECILRGVCRVHGEETCESLYCKMSSRADDGWRALSIAVGNILLSLFSVAIDLLAVTLVHRII